MVFVSLTAAYIVPVELACMSEMPIPEASHHLADMAHHAADTGSVVYLTEHGNRLAAIVPAALAIRLEDTEAQRIRQQLADAGLLAPVERLREEGPSEDTLAAARARAGQGTPLSDFISSGR